MLLWLRRPGQARFEELAADRERVQRLTHCRHLYVRGGWLAWLYSAGGALAPRLAKSFGDGVGALGEGVRDVLAFLGSGLE